MMWISNLSFGVRVHLWLLLTLACTGALRAQVLDSQSPNAPTPNSGLSQAQALVDEGKYDDALARLRQLERQEPSAKGVEHELGIAYYRKGDFAEAEPAFAKAMAEDPQDHEAVQLRGLSLFRLGRPADAISYLKQVQSWVGTGSVDANYVLGLCYIHTQNYDEARHAFAQLYGVPPDSGAAHLFL